MYINFDNIGIQRQLPKSRRRTVAKLNETRSARGSGRSQINNDAKLNVKKKNFTPTKFG